jgi:Mycobacterial 4 TMS phage holin, superfamily IV
VGVATGLITRLIVVALSLWLATELVPGIETQGGWTLVGAAILLGLVNAVVRPVLVVLTFCSRLFGLIAEFSATHSLAGRLIVDDEPDPIHLNVRRERGAVVNSSAASLNQLPARCDRANARGGKRLVQPVSTSP